MIFFPKIRITLSLVFTSMCIITPIYATESGTWKDSKTGLTWQRCSLGQTWNGYDCDGKPKDYRWENIQQAVSVIGEGWRLPAASELMSLVRCNTGFRTASFFPDSKGVNKKMPRFCNDGASYPTIDKTIFPNTPNSFFWSSSSVAHDTGLVWIVHFHVGCDGYGIKDSWSDRYYVRLVRTSQ